MFLFVRRYAPFATFGGGFEGDIREAASTSSTATARTVGVVLFDSSSAAAYASFSDGTRYLKAGPWLASKIGKKFSTIKSEVTDVSIGYRSISFSVVTAGANPLLPKVVTPDIDTYVDIAISFGELANRYEGSVYGDSFPNAEVFVVDDSAKETLLFDYRTSGNPVTGPGRLFGNHKDQLLGTFAVNAVTIGPPAPVAAIQGK